MLKVIIFLLISVFSFSKLFAEDIPIIVISAGKTYQSKSIVGSDVVVVDSKAISESNEFFLGDVLSGSLNGMNYFQTGGHGTTSGIQLRGLPKRYSTVYIDGVKVSDPSSPSNDYYFGNLMKGSIDRVEILKGSQSSLYGSSAIGGTINLFTKKGKEGHHNNIEVSTGSNATKNFNISFDGKEENYDYFVGFNKFLTDGISVMWDNDEKDKYYNDGVVANFGYNINDKIRLLRILNKYQPIGIFNLAAETHVDRSIENPKNFIKSNILGIFNLLENFKKYIKKNKKTKLIHISTDEVFGDVLKNRSKEEDKYKPSSPYAASKAASDHLVYSYFRTFNLPVIITNCSNNYGPRQHPEKLIPKLINIKLTIL